MSQILLEAFNSIPYPTERTEKNGMMDISYTFEDETNHSFRFHFEKRVNYGRNVFVLTLGQKSPNIKMYKRVFGKFHNPLRVIATLIDIVKDNRQKRSDVKGLIIEVPEQAFGAHGRLVDKIIKRELRTELKVQDLELSIEEFEKMGLKGVVATVKPYQFDSVFNGKIMKDILDKRSEGEQSAENTPVPEKPVVRSTIDTLIRGVGNTQLQIDVKYDGDFQGGKSFRVGIVGLKKAGDKDINDIMDEYGFSFESGSNILQLYSYPASRADKIDADLADAMSRINRFTDFKVSIREKKVNITYLVKNIERATACFSIREEMLVAYHALVDSGIEDVATLTNGQGEDKYRIIDATGELTAQAFADILQPLIGRAFEVRDKDKGSQTAVGYDAPLEDARIVITVDEGNESGTAHIVFQHPSETERSGIQDAIAAIVKKVIPQARRADGSQVDDMFSMVVKGGYLTWNDKIEEIANALNDEHAEAVFHPPEVPDHIKALGNAIKQHNETMTYKTKDGFVFEVNGRKLTFKADVNFNSIMDYVFGWFKSEFDTIDNKRQFVDKTNGDNLTQNFISVLQKLSISEVITQKVSEQFDQIISKTHKERDLSTTMYERSIGAPAGLFSDYREFKGEIVLDDNGSAFALFSSNAGPFVKSAREQFGSADFETKGNLNTLKIALDGNFSIKEFDAGLVGKFLKSHDDNFGVLSTRFYPVKIIKSGKVTYQSARQYASISLNQDLACYLSGLENYDQNSKTSSTVSFEGVETLSDFYDLCDKLSDYDFEGNYLKAFRFSKYINDAKANGGKLEITKGEKSVKVEIQEDMIFINLTGMSLPEISMPLWKKGETSVFLRTYYLGHKKFNDVLAVLDNYLDKELSEATTSEIAGADDISTVEQKFHLEHQKGGFKIVTTSPLATILLLNDLQLDLTDNKDGSVYVKLSHFSKTVGTKKQVVNALTAAGYVEGEHVATPGSAASTPKAKLDTSDAKPSKQSIDVQIEDAIESNKGHAEEVLKESFKYNTSGHTVANYKFLRAVRPKDGYVLYVFELMVSPKFGSPVKQKAFVKGYIETDALIGYTGSGAERKPVIAPVRISIDRTVTSWVGYDYEPDVAERFEKTMSFDEPKGTVDSVNPSPLRIDFTVNDSLGRVYIVRVDSTSVMISDSSGKNNPTAYGNLFKPSFKRLANEAFNAAVDIEQFKSIVNSQLEGGAKIGIKQPVYIFSKKDVSAEQPKVVADITIASNKVIAKKAPKIERKKISDSSYAFTADGVTIATASKTKVKGLNSSGWAAAEGNSGINLSGYETIVTLFNDFKAKYIAWYMDNAATVSIPAFDLKQFTTVKPDVKAKFNTRSVGLPSQDTINSKTFNSAGYEIKISSAGVEIKAENKKISLSNIEMRLKAHGVKTTMQKVGQAVVTFKQGLNDYEFSITEKFMHFKGLRGGVPHSASNFVFVPNSVANGTEERSRYAQDGLRAIYEKEGSVKEMGQFIQHMSGYRTEILSTDDRRQPLLTAHLDMTKQANVDLIKSILSTSETMNESIKEDLTGVAPKVNKVDKSLLEKSMRQLGMYQSSFAYGGSTFNVTLNEGVVDILPTSGNVAYLSKLLGVKLGQDLVQDERGGLRFDIA